MSSFLGVTIYNLIYTYFLEVFENKNKIVGISVLSITFFIIFPSFLYLRNYLLNLEESSFLVLLPFAILSCFTTLFLPETLHQGLKT